MYPDLELWVDGDNDTAVVTVDGTLDERTCPSLVRAVNGLVAEGYREVLVHPGNLEIPPGSGSSVLAHIRRSFDALQVPGEWTEKRLLLRAPESKNRLSLGEEPDPAHPGQGPTSPCIC